MLDLLILISVQDDTRGNTDGKNDRGVFAIPTPLDKNKNPSQNYFQEGFVCFGRDSNPYGHCCPRDFKSRVSTYSTTKAIRGAKII